MEVEVIDPERFNYKEFMDTVFIVVDTQVDPRFKLNSFFNKALGGSPKDEGRLNWNLIKRPRDLTMDDLTCDGLLDHFAITVKADGEMRFLIFHTSGTWLVHFSKDYDNNYELISPDGEDEKQGGSIFQGELVGNNFHPFDCCMNHGKVVTNMHYLERMKNADRIHGQRYGKCNIVPLKMYTYGAKKVEFFNRNREAFRHLEKADYKTDGLVFHPLFCPYLPPGQNLPKDKRKLSNAKDACKWKDSDDQSIDFEVIDGRLFSARTTLFEGTREHPFCENNYTLTSDVKNVIKLTPKMLEDKIVEFKPYLTSEGGRDSFIYKPFRIRDDKESPNNLEVALEGWKLVRDPITKEMLTGRSTRLLGEYQKEVRKSIIKSQSQNHKGFRAVEVLPRSGERGLGVDEDDYEDRNVVFLTSDPLHLSEGKKGVRAFNELECHGCSEDLDINFFLTSHLITQELKSFVKSYKGKVHINIFDISTPVLKSTFSMKKGEIKHGDIEIKRVNSDTYSISSLSSPFTGEGGGREEKRKFFNPEEHGLKLIDEQRFKANSRQDPILTKDEKDHIHLYSHGKYQFDTDSEDSSRNIQVKGRLPVDITRGTKMIGGFKAYGDDKLEKLEGDLHRMATLDEGNSLGHSLMKLLNTEYRSGTLNRRMKMSEGVNADSKIKDISKEIKHGIFVKKNPQNGGDRKYGKGSRWIILFKHDDGTYEPVVHKSEDKLNMVFSEDSSLISDE